MAASVKSKAELEQVALAMMMMAEGEGTQVTEGRKTRSSSSRICSAEPVSSNGRRNSNKKTNHDQPGSPENDEESNAPDRSPNSESELVINEDGQDEAIICAINPMSIQSCPSPDSPTDSPRSTNSGSGSGQAASYSPYISTARRIFKPEFKQMVLDAFSNDPECVGNQRATARKFGIHRRQVQKWLQQYSTGELTFKDSQENEDSYAAEPKELTKRKATSISTATLQLPSARSKVTRRSTGNQPSAQQAAPRSLGAASRATRASVRNRGKSMPLKGGSKSTAQFVPTIVHHSSSAPSKSLINLSKGSKQNGASSRNNNNRSPLTYYDSNGNGSGGGNGRDSGNMFMNMSSFLASAAAAGNLSMPLSLENSRNFSPRDHSPINNGRGSPTHSAGGSSGGSGSNNSIQNALNLVDELNYLYPYSDFSLLRKALLKEEVSLEKLAHPLIRTKNEFRINGVASDLSQGLRDLRRAAALSPSPAKSSSSPQEYNTQQTLDIIRQQQEYLKLLQQCGIGSSGELGGLNVADLPTNGRLPAWFNPFAAAAAAGLSIPSTSGKYGGTANGNGDSRRKPSATETSDNHRFASPRVPPAINSGKAKTVAAALAATRVQSTTSHHGLGRNFQNNHHHGNGRQGQNQRQPPRRKGNTRQSRGQSQHSMDDDIDPTSMLEVVTSIPSPSCSPRNSQYGYNNNHRSNDYHQSQNQGMDLSTTSAPSTSHNTMTSSTPRLVRSKATQKEYAFLNDLGLYRKSPEKETTSPSTNNGYGMTHTASLENFVHNILPPRQKSPPVASSSSSSNSPPAPEHGSSDSEKTKSMVIDAFNYDPEISGDARAVARKFGLNARVVMKWLKEGLMKSSPQSTEGYHHPSENGVHTESHLVNGMLPRDDMEDETASDYLKTQNLHKAMLNESNNNSTGSAGTTTVNKRKNSKPNQICDFPEDEAGLSGALDMVVPIKKRRVSSPSPTHHDA